MKPSIWDKARELLEKKKIRLIGSGNDREFFDVGEDVHIQLINDKKGEYFSCTCKHCSIHNSVRAVQKESPYLCSYTIALNAYLMMNRGR